MIARSESTPSSSALLTGLDISPTELRSAHLLSNTILSSFNKLGIRPENYPDLASQPTRVSTDLVTTYQAALEQSEKDLEEVERYYSSRSQQYQQLDNQIRSSERILGTLSTFLSEFQTDLSSVSSSIAELQGRSKIIESKLESCRSLESSLKPYINQTIISPTLIHIILNTDPSEQWIEPIQELETKLTSLKIFGLQIKPTESSEEVAEKLRLVASYKIRSFFIHALEPFRSSITTNLHISQSSFFLKYQILFAFLQRHSARIAHEVQKAYVGTVRWYLETGLRRYVRALDSIRVRGWRKAGSIVDSAKESSPASQAVHPSIISQSKLDGGGVILAYMAESSSYRQPPDALFRSLSLVVADNIGSEYNFVSEFFGRSKRKREDGRNDNDDRSETVNSTQEGLSQYSGNRTMTLRKRKNSIGTESVDDSVSVLTGMSEMVRSSVGGGSNGERRSQTAVDMVWKEIVEPVLEYHKTFTSRLLTTNDLPDTTRLYAMIQLNQTILKTIDGQCAQMESHLTSIKMKLWPMFQIKMNEEINSLERLANSIATMNASGSQKIDMDERRMERVSQTYVWFFLTMIGMINQIEEEEEDQEKESSISRRVLVNEETKVLNDLKRLRDKLVNILQQYSLNRHPSDPALRKKTLNSFYVQIQQELSVEGLNQVQSQAEISFWRELGWRTR